MTHTFHWFSTDLFSFSFFAFSALNNLHSDSASLVHIFKKYFVYLKNKTWMRKHCSRPQDLWESWISVHRPTVCAAVDFSVVHLISTKSCWTFHGCQMRISLWQRPACHLACTWILGTWASRVREGMWKEKFHFAFIWGYWALNETSLRPLFPNHHHGKTPVPLLDFKRQHDYS